MRRRSGSFVPTCPAMERRPNRHFVALSLLLAACGPTVVVNVDSGGEGGPGDGPPVDASTSYGESESGGVTGVTVGSTGTTGEPGSTTGDTSSGGSSGSSGSTGEPFCEPVWDPTYTWATCMCDGTEAPPEACECNLDETGACWCGVNLYPSSTCCEMEWINPSVAQCQCGGVAGVSWPPEMCGCVKLATGCECDGEPFDTSACCDVNPPFPQAPGC